MVDKRKIKKQHPKCGREFSPAGYAIHARYCTGPGYKPTHSHSPAGPHDTAEKRLARAAKKMVEAHKASVSDGRKDIVLCSKGCGRELKAAGRPHHEKYCTGPGYVPGYSAQRRQERRISVHPKSKIKMTKQTATPAYTAYYAPINAVKWAYEMFPEDSALFSAVCHIAACKVESDVEEQIKHLTQARDMLSLKIENLSD